MEVIDMYFKLIIIPLEKEIKFLKRKINKKRFSLTKKIDKNYLEKLEILLNQHYQKFTNLIINELSFEKKFQKKLKYLEK